MAKTTAVTDAFSEGDCVIHPQQGAGRVQCIMELSLTGTPRTYYSIELLNGKGTLMVPVDEVEALGLREAEFGVAELEVIFNEAPEALSDNHKNRQSVISELLYSGNPRKIAEALRDLCWREEVGRLTLRDHALKDQALRVLTGEVAAYADVTLDTASKHVSSLLDAAIERRAAAGGASAD